jgi:hypothetical protein
MQRLFSLLANEISQLLCRDVLNLGELARRAAQIPTTFRAAQPSFKKGIFGDLPEYAVLATRRA